MTRQSQSDHLNRDENDDRRNYNNQILLVSEKRSEGMETSVDVEGVVILDDAISNADARRTSKVDVRVDRQAFIAIEKGGTVRGIDDDIWHSGDAATRWDVTEGVTVIQFCLIRSNIGL